MRNNVTELVFIVDCSFFTAGKEEKMAEIINQTIKKYRYGGGYVNTFLFGGDRAIFHDRLKIHTVKPVAFTDFSKVSSASSLYYDTLVSAIRHIFNIHYYIRPEDVPDKTLFYIITAGMDTASVRYNRQSAMALVENMKKEKGWEFIFEDMSSPVFSSAASDKYSTAEAFSSPSAEKQVATPCPDDFVPVTEKDTEEEIDYGLDVIIKMLRDRASG